MTTSPQNNSRSTAWLDFTQAVAGGSGLVFAASLIGKLDATSNLANAGPVNIALLVSAVTASLASVAYSGLRMTNFDHNPRTTDKTGQRCGLATGVLLSLGMTYAAHNIMVDGAKTPSFTIPKAECLAPMRPC